MAEDHDTQESKRQALRAQAPTKYSSAPRQRPEAISLGVAVRSWGVSAHVLYHLEAQGRLHPIRLGQKVLYSSAELAAVLGDRDSSNHYPAAPERASA